MRKITIVTFGREIKIKNTRKKSINLISNISALCKITMGMF